MDNSGSVRPNPELLRRCAYIFGAEIVIDITKHAVLSKLNDIHPSVYQRFMRVCNCSPWCHHAPAVCVTDAVTRLRGALLLCCHDRGCHKVCSEEAECHILLHGVGSFTCLTVSGSATLSTNALTKMIKAILPTSKSGGIGQGRVSHGDVPGAWIS